MIKRSSLAAAALAFGAVAMTGQAVAAAPKPCLTADEAENLFLAVAPDAYRAVATACTAALPETALLRHFDNAMIQGLQSAADQAWPHAQPGIAKLAGADAAPYLNNDGARALVGSVIGQLAVKKIKPSDCVAVDRILGLLQPLPPRNMAALIVTIIQLTNSGKKHEDFQICPATPASAQ